MIYQHFITGKRGKRMIRSIIVASAVMLIFAASSSMALDNAALIGKWVLVENAKDKTGKPCPFVGKKIEFTADGKMISPNMPVPFQYKVNPEKQELEGALTRNPELKGMEIMLAAIGNQKIDWSHARIVYGLELKGNKLTMKVSGYTPARYKRMK